MTSMFPKPKYREVIVWIICVIALALVTWYFYLNNNEFYRG